MLDTLRMSIIVTEYTNELMHDYLNSCIPREEKR